MTHVSFWCKSKSWGWEKYIFSLIFLNLKSRYPEFILLMEKFDDLVILFNILFQKLSYLKDSFKNTLYFLIFYLNILCVCERFEGSAATWQMSSNILWNVSHLAVTHQSAVRIADTCRSLQHFIHEHRPVLFFH